MPERLYRLRLGKITRISFVPAGDNPEANVMLMKSRPDANTAAGSDPVTVLNTMAAEVAKRTNLSPADALAAVCSTPVGKRLYADYRADMADA